MAIELLPRFQPDVFPFSLDMAEMVRKRAEYNAGLSHMQFLDIFFIKNEAINDIMLSKESPF